MKAKYCLQMYNRIIISNFPRNLIIISQFLSFFSLFFHFFKFWSYLGYLLTPPDPWGTHTFWLWSWIYPRSPWDVSQLQKCKNPDMAIFTFSHFSLFGGPLEGELSPKRLHMVPNFRILAHTSFLYNWMIFRHKSGYKCRKISCSVKIIQKTSILSDSDPFIISQQFLCKHKSQILFTNIK